MTPLTKHMFEALGFLALGSCTVIRHHPDGVIGQRTAKALVRNGYAMWDRRTGEMTITRAGRAAYEAALTVRK